MPGIMYMSAVGETNELSFVNDLDTWLDTYNHMLANSLLDMNLAIDCLEQITEHNPFRFDPAMQRCYYHLENTAYRLTTMWDVLGQIIKLWADMAHPIESKTYLTTVLKEARKETQRAKLTTKMTNFIDSVYEYTAQDDDCASIPGTGHFSYVRNTIRNAMAHRNSPFRPRSRNHPAASFIHFPDHPSVVLGRFVEDYVQCNLFAHTLRSNIDVSNDLMSIIKGVLPTNT